MKNATLWGIFLIPHNVGFWSLKSNIVRKSRKKMRNPTLSGIFMLDQAYQGHQGCQGCLQKHQKFNKSNIVRKSSFWHWNSSQRWISWALNPTLWGIKMRKGFFRLFLTMLDFQIQNPTLWGIKKKSSQCWIFHLFLALPGNVGF